jgi:hypothetical protein
MGYRVAVQRYPDRRHRPRRPARWGRRISASVIPPVRVVPRADAGVGGGRSGSLRVAVRAAPRFRQRSFAARLARRNVGAGGGQS